MRFKPQPCVPFALAASTVAMLMGIEEGGKKWSRQRQPETADTTVTSNRKPRCNKQGKQMAEYRPTPMAHYGCKIQATVKPSLKHNS